MKPPAGHQASEQSAQLRKFLVQEGLVSPSHMAVAQYDEEQTGLSLEEILLLHGWVDPTALNRASLKVCREQLNTILQSPHAAHHHES